MSDTVRMVFTYLIALVIVIGGGAFLFMTRAEPDAQGTSLVIAGFIGAAITFVFGQEGATRAARQTVSAVDAGAVTHANGIANVEHAARVAATTPRP
jgi:hypothetical protein